MNLFGFWVLRGGLFCTFQLHQQAFLCDEPLVYRVNS